MIKNYLIVLLRNLLKNKSYMLLNILGLSIAFVVMLLTGTHLIDELSYDQFHSKKDNIHRLYKRNVNLTTGAETLTTETSGMMGPTMYSDYPEVQNFTRVLPWFDETVISKNEVNIYIEYPVFVDSTFFNVFDFKLLKGNRETALVRPNTIVLSEDLANNLFGEDDPIGQTVIGLRDLEYEVTGVVENPPVQSHLQYDALISWTTTVGGIGGLDYSFMNNWLGQTLLTYLTLSPNTDTKDLEDKLPAMMQKYFPERADSYFLKLQPLSDVYLHSEDMATYARIKQGSSSNLKVFMFTSLFILIIACVNYINISTAKATKRASEIGMRKVLGANKQQLIFQFLGESFIITLISALLAVLVADLMLPFFGQLVDKQLAYDSLFQLELVSGFIGLIIIITIAAGLYPAFVLAKFKPSDVLMGSGKSNISGHLPRQILSTIQFAIAIAMIIATIMVFYQTSFLKNKSLGFDKEHLLIININNSIRDKYKTFKNQLLEHPDIIEASVCQATIGSGTFGTTVIPEGQTEEMSSNVFRVDANFIKTTGIKMAEGRAFDGLIASDSNAIIVNQTFVERANWDNPLEKTIRFEVDQEPYPIIGVVEDFHFEGLNESEVRPIVMYIHPENFTNVTLRISGNNIKETLAHIEDKWNLHESRFPFSYYFADSWFDARYKKETQLMDAIAILSSISILLACLGLYGLTAFTIEQRAKEIGIRKVLGATVMNLTFMLNKKFILLLCLAFAISAPCAFYYLNSWLNGFPYHIDMTVQPFVLALISTLIITLLAVSFQTIKAAILNPVITLKRE